MWIWKAATSRFSQVQLSKARETAANECLKPRRLRPPLHLRHPLLLVPDWRHAAETHRGGFSSVCLRVTGNLVRCEGRREGAERKRKRKISGRRRRRESATIANMSLPTNCVYLAPSVQDRYFKVRNGNVCGSPCAVNRPIDIVQKRRR